MESMQDKETAP